MNARRIVFVVLGLLIVVVVLFYLLDPDARLAGALRGDPWYRGRPATAWRNDLTSRDDNTRALAAEQLKDEAAVPVLEALLKSGGPPEPRWVAADVLGKIGPPARSAGPALLAALNDPDPQVRTVAVQAIGKLAPDVPGAVPKLIELFPDVEAIRAAAQFKGAAAEAVPKLTELLTHQDAGVRWNASRALGKIGEPAKSAIPGIVGQLKDEDRLVREHAAEALGDIGPAAAAAVPDLVKALSDSEWKVRRDALGALGNMGPAAKAALPQVQALKKDPEAEVRAAAERAEQRITRQGNPGREPERD
jgi:HEAT repeat protein